MLNKYFENDDRIEFCIPDGPDALYKVYNTKYLLTHGHLIIDGNREYIDGALLIEGERIVDVFPQSNKLPEINEEYKLI